MKAATLLATVKAEAKERWDFESIMTEVKLSQRKRRFVCISQHPRPPLRGRINTMMQRSINCLRTMEARADIFIGNGTVATLPNRHLHHHRNTTAYTAHFPTPLTTITLTIVSRRP